MINAFTVDVEEYFQVHNFEDVIRYEEWENFESRIEYQVNLILNLLKEKNVKATFFILGWVAERHPELIKRIYEEGHEIGTHGYKHLIIYRLTPKQFERDLRTSIEILQEIIKDKILGFRAPSFSITKESLWALEILKKCGIKYDSSIYPCNSVIHGRYGLPGIRLSPHQIIDGLWEFPMSIVKIFKLSLPVGGGGWLRHYPFSFTKWALRKINQEKRPFIIYIHPWEFDDKQPRIQTNLWRGFLHYNNLSYTLNRIKSLLKKFEFKPIREILNL